MSIKYSWGSRTRRTKCSGIGALILGKTVGLCVGGEGLAGKASSLRTEAFSLLYVRHI